MRDCYAHDASRVATTILERIAGLVIPGAPAATASRQASASRAAPTQDAAAQALAAADHACYVAKHSGRNRFAVAKGSDECAEHPSALATHAPT